ncbi:fibronectin type III domain-containing protein [Chryseobacterium gwangjuense]|uniref:fibronectin type III domain-containing protein n=1 Tax=Chryseobacterium gwangjuense TaxID=1069980 RepID=UPI001E4B9C6A|nr:fibronectin type III domain-containing protein [Chryseobacterium gwangjuense]MCE3077154.1 fibronectin type III domain-containing protein [Chryseobacterium gwangjuense]
MKKLLLMCQLLFGSFLMAQVAYTQNWAATGLNNWVTSGSVFSNNTTANQICGTSGGTIRGELYYGTSGQFTSPNLTGNNAGQVTMSFDYKVTDYFAGTSATPSNKIGNIKVEYATTATGPWITAYTINSANHVSSNTCATKTITFIPQAGNLYVRFNATSDNNADVYYYFDNVSISQSAVSTCPPPSAITLGTVTAATAVISWTAPTPAPANGYDVYYNTTGIPPTSGTVLNGTNSVPSTTTTATIPGLSPTTTYYVWVRAKCSATDQSYWIPMTSTFTTPCVSISTFPWSENFDSMTSIGAGVLPSCWATTGGSDIFTTQDASSQGYNDPKSTPNYVTIYYPTTAAYLWTPSFHLTANQSYDFSFYWVGDGYSGWDGNVLVNTAQSSTGATTLSTFITSTQTTTGGSNSTSYTKVKVTFVPTTTGEYNFGIKSFAATFDPYYLGFDDFNVMPTPTCVEPAGMAVSGVASNTSTLNWTAPNPVPANGYEYYISTTNTPPTASTGPVTGTSITLPTTLTPNTTYYWWVRAICSTTSSSIWIQGPTFTTTQIPATLPYSQPFTTNDFGFGNGSQPNKWYFGSAAGNPANSLFISADNGVTNGYDEGITSVTHAYRDFTIPAGTTAASPAILTFDWRAVGEGTPPYLYDYISVWMVPSSYTPSAGNAIAAGTNRVLLGQLNQQSAWQNYVNTNLDLSGYAGGVMRLVFEWKNDGFGGTSPAGAIDNINLLIPTCKVPTALAVTGIVSNGATISWTAPTPAPAGGYVYYISTSNVPPGAGTPGTPITGTTVNLAPTLTPNTTYYWWVRAVCSSTDSSIWIPGPSFMTTQIPAALPYLQDFSGSNDFGMLNTGQPNIWFHGSATGNTGKSLYITNDNGVTNAYTNDVTSIVQAYRDITIPAGTSLATFSFDWKADGESSWDYLRVWLVPTNFLPTPGTPITAATGTPGAPGRVQVGQYNQNGTTWQSYSNANLNLTNFAGTTMRLVFEWTNDSYGGTQPPVAIDNIVLRVCSTATPVVTVIPASITHNSAQITWPQDTGGASYKVRYRPVGSTQWLPTAGPIDVAAVTAPNQPPLTLSGLIPATDYEVEVAAVCNTINVGVYSHNVFTTKCDPTPPNVTFTNITSTSAVVNWSPLAASATYEMQWRKVGDPTWIGPIALPNPPANTYALPSPGYTLTPYTQYEVQVRNICVGSTTPNPWSSLSRFTTERTCEIPPPGLTILELKPTSAKVQWDPYVGPDATGKYILRYRKVGIPGWTSVPVSTNLYTLTDLTELTKYEMQVANVCSGTPGNYTLPYYFTTPTVIYCQMGATTGSGDYISKVTVVPNGKPQMIKDSGVSNYTDYTADPLAQIEMIQGSVNNQLTIDKVVTGDAGVVAWIDFDRNGEFDINERILVSGPNADATATATFSVPSDAFVSNVDYMYVVMRVALMKGGLPVNCTNFDKGEVEDYTVRITKKAAANVLNQSDILIYPNPVSTVLNVTNISKRANFKIYNAAGQLVTKGIILNNKVDVRSLINGVYMIDIEDGSTSVQKKFIKE